MALFGNTEKAKDKQLEKILSNNSKDKTLDEIQLETKPQQTRSLLEYQEDVDEDGNRYISPASFQKYQMREKLQELRPTPQPSDPTLNLNTQTKETSQIPMEMQNVSDQSQSLFGDLAMREDTQNVNPYDFVLGEEPTIDEDRLKRAKTQDLINAFGDLLRGGVGLGMMQSGEVVTDNLITPQSKGIPNIQGVYDDYYKELADYRDKQTSVNLAQIQDASRQASDEAKMQFDREKLEATRQASADALEQDQSQFLDKLKQDQSQFEKTSELKQSEINNRNLANKNLADRLGLELEKFKEQQLQNDRGYNEFYINLDEERKASADALLLKRTELDQLIKRNDNAELKTGFDAVKEGRDALVDTYGLTYGDAVTTLREDPESEDGKDAQRYIDQYNELAELEQILFTRLRGDDQVNNQVTTSQAVEQNNDSAKTVQDTIANQINDQFGDIDGDFVETLFGKGMANGGSLNATNIQNAIVYLENPQNISRIQQEFGFGDDELEGKRQNLVNNLKINLRQLQSLNQ